MILHRLFLIAALLCLPSIAAAQSFPELTGRVVDGANLLDPAQEQALTAKLSQLEKQTGRQLVVATLRDLQGYDIADYGYRLGRKWGIGRKEANDGALLIVAPKERKVRIEVGYGLEGVLTDATSALIINNRIIPRFKAGDFPGGISAGVDAIIGILRLPPEQAKARAAELETEARRHEGGGAGAAIFGGIFVIFFVVLPLLRRGLGGGRRYRRGAAWPIMLWGPTLGGGGRSWGGGRGGFGGGFSGGGGSFGGGGASGGW